MGNSGSAENVATKEGCIICKIIEESDDNKILTQNESYVLFSDIHPASSKHYLIVPRYHYHSPKTLHTQEHIDMIEEMIAFGSEYLVQQGGSLKDCKVGFHWPPFTTVNHLHLHLIYPASSMTWMFRMMYHSSVFVPPQYAIDYIKSKL